MAFDILVTADAEVDLDALRAYDRAAIVEAMEAHLKGQPTQVSRGRINTGGEEEMKILELNGRSPSLAELLEAAQAEDILLVRDGHPLARLEKFDEDDWQDFQYESSAQALERGQHARAQYARGEFKPLEQVKEEHTRTHAADH